MSTNPDLRLLGCSGALSLFKNLLSFSEIICFLLPSSERHRESVHNSWVRDHISGLLQPVRLKFSVSQPTLKPCSGKKFQPNRTDSLGDVTKWNHCNFFKMKKSWIFLFLLGLSVHLKWVRVISLASFNLQGWNFVPEQGWRVGWLTPNFNLLG